MSDVRHGDDDRAFDEALIASAMTEVAAHGWSGFRLADAARAAALPMAKVRQRYPTPDTVLLRLGQFADEAALADGEAGELAGGPPLPPRERLFDMIMRRLDVFQQHRPGVVALLDGLPAAPGTALMLAGATTASMRWIADAAGIPLDGFGGAMRLQAVNGIWLVAIRAWTRDDTVDLAPTMASVDRALDRLARFDRAFGRNVVDAAGDLAMGDETVDGGLADIIVPPDELDEGPALA